MELELINAFVQPYESEDALIRDAFAAAKYLAAKPDDQNALGSHIKKQVVAQRKQQNWKETTKKTIPTALKAYKNNYSKCDKNKADSELKKLNITMTPGQILFHGGMLKTESQTNHIVLASPLSTTFSPVVAISEALWNGKAFDSEALHVNVLTIRDSEAKVFPFKPNQKLGRELEVLLESGLILEKTKDFLACSSYEVSNAEGTRRKVGYHVIEWDVFSTKQADS